VLNQATNLCQIVGGRLSELNHIEKLKVKLNMNIHQNCGNTIPLEVGILFPYPKPFQRKSEKTKKIRLGRPSEGARSNGESAI